MGKNWYGEKREATTLRRRTAAGKKGKMIGRLECLGEFFGERALPGLTSSGRSSCIRGTLACLVVGRSTGIAGNGRTFRAVHSWRRLSAFSGLRRLCRIGAE